MVSDDHYSETKWAEHKKLVCREWRTAFQFLQLATKAIPAPKPLLNHSMASPSVVAEVIYQKYVNHVPLYRQEQGWKGRDVAFSRTTMANWTIRCAEDWLVSVWEAMRKELLQREVLHADETTVQVLKEKGKAPTTKSYMWLYCTGNDGPAANRPVRLQDQPQRSYMENYLEDPRCEISNNRAENKIRPFTVGRKNWLFSDTPAGAKASAVIYSIVGTAKANNLAPRDYIQFLFENLPDMEIQTHPERLDQMLPWGKLIQENFA